CTRSREPVRVGQGGRGAEIQGFGHHPLAAGCDNTAEPLAWMLRPGSAGSNTAADHLRLLGEAIAALPPRHRRKLLLTRGGASANHNLVTELDRLGARPRDQGIYLVGWGLGARRRAPPARGPGTPGRPP